MKGDPMTRTTEQEILQHEEQLHTAKRALDLNALDRIYADDLLLTGVLGEPTCSKPVVIDEVKRGIAERETAKAGGQQFQMSSENEDMKIATHGDAAVANYRFVVKVKGTNIDIHRRYRVTNVWIKRDGRWQIVAGHTALVLDAKPLAALGG
jgi:ketosteroid isomerase-like protein